MMIPVLTEWEPFQFRPDTPEDGIDLIEAIRDWNGPDAAEMFDSDRNPIYHLGLNEGITFNRGRRIVNTSAAHRLVKWVDDTGALAQHDLMESLFNHYHQRAADISKHDTLVEFGSSLCYIRHISNYCIVTSPGRYCSTGRARSSRGFIIPAHK
jgi:predicted DsbA family dithiol-disulfide isomerase